MKCEKCGNTNIMITIKSVYESEMMNADEFFNGKDFDDVSKILSRQLVAICPKCGNTERFIVSEEEFTHLKNLKINV